MSDKTKPLRILVVGCGNMGASHAWAYHTMDGFEICGLVSKGKTNEVLNKKLGGGYPLFSDFDVALEATKPDAVSISTYPDTHERFAIKSMENGCHVFIEKPLADSVKGAERVAAAAKKFKKKLVVGYILRHHPSWERFIELSHELGKPLVMRMNLNQQSDGAMWTLHRNLMKSLSPIVDCGVHYIDVMCQMTRSKPVQVYAIGARLTEEIPAGNYNYGQLQIRFEGCRWTKRIRVDRCQGSGRIGEIGLHRGAYQNGIVAVPSCRPGQEGIICEGRHLDRSQRRTRSSGTLQPGAALFLKIHQREY